MDWQRGRVVPQVRIDVGLWEPDEQGLVVRGHGLGKLAGADGRRVGDEVAVAGDLRPEDEVGSGERPSPPAGPWLGRGAQLTSRTNAAESNATRAANPARRWRALSPSPQPSPPLCGVRSRFAASRTARGEGTARPFTRLAPSISA